MALLSTNSWYTQQSNDSSKGYAIAASHSSYQYYNDMSWSMWVMASPGNSKHIWSLWEQVSGNNRSWLFSTQTDGSFRCLFSWNGTSFSNHKTSTNLCDYTWHHLVFTFSNGTIGCYVDGASHTLTQTTAWSGGVAGLHNPAIQHIVTGHSPSAPVADASPSASFCNFSLWSKVLSAAEVSEIYNNGTPADLSTHSAVANLTNWLRMDQTDSGSTLVDSVTSSANCTITTSGTSGVFKKGGNYPVNRDDLIASAVWGASTSDYADSGTFGAWIQKLLSVAKFMGLK